MPEIRVSVDFRHSITVGFSDTFFQNETEIQTKVSRFQTIQKCLKTEHTKVWISDTYVLYFESNHLGPKTLKLN